LEKGIFVIILPSLRQLTQAALLFPCPIWCNTDIFGDPMMKKGNAVNAKTIFEDKIKCEVKTKDRRNELQSTSKFNMYDVIS
jgi:hypothetical protein